ncbi:ferritin-like domain-containing protein [Nonlabens ponticola]|uniref:PA2169 family four-helix-bundle protein n=1 Tax=Nonlabens ponticola TaxID=2496866 RepID=A0A3S9N0D8_9FLAO|nr:PA2169 family four-helix-bundle protein [Nonlabens ponticola]AZQ44877.1 PA2169 family four-helix-bundle protein [Nonlabens ponticola]
MKTTREEAHELIHDTTVSKLNELLEKSYDAEKGFKHAIEKVDNDRLKEYFKQRAAQRSHFATELHQQLHQLNEEPSTTGSTAGDLHRSWMDIKAAFSSDNEESILEECIRGEKASVDEYKEILKSETLLAEVVPILENQWKQVENSLSTVKKLEDLQ